MHNDNLEGTSSIQQEVDNNHSLIILGNGFDLHCKLETSYFDFYQSRKKLLSIENKSLNDILNATGIRSISNFHLKVLFSNSHILDHFNFWDIVYFLSFKSHKDKDWQDIEKIIYNFLIDNKSLINLSHTLECLNYLIDDVEESLWNQSIQKENYIFASFLFTKFAYQSKVNDSQVHSDLLLELNSFEKNFMNFVKEQRKGTAYYSLAHLTLEKLNKKNKKYKLLNFNYTNPELNYKKKTRENLLLTENVHGDIQVGAIIFGIDHSNIEYTSPGYSFTKTSRKIFSSDLYPKNNAILSAGLNEIIIFGHSLNAADMSYFKSIFDFCNLYQSNTNLIVYYTNYNSDEKSRKYGQVIKLINLYGSTLKEHEGKNLIHKLLLENRIQIRELI